jgi:hypothetical protein
MRFYPPINVRYPVNIVAASVDPVFHASSLL